MENILVQYNKLDQFSQQLVAEFIELLIKQQAKRHAPSRNKGTPKHKFEQKPDITQPDQPHFDYQAYRNKLLSLKPWSADEIKTFDENLTLFKNMKMETW
ncbi:MAG: hypothetical protein IT258_07255 [Saprospiraceae bacterium]|nr:hypothetical protein [Saprospiraceae bacterium]